MELKEIILNEIKQEIASEKGYSDWEDCKFRSPTDSFVYYCFLANSKALDRLDKVMRWAMKSGYTIKIETWFFHPIDGAVTDAELYELFKSQSE